MAACREHPKVSEWLGLQESILSTAEWESQNGAFHSFPPTFLGLISWVFIVIFTAVFGSQFMLFLPKSLLLSLK